MQVQQRRGCNIINEQLGMLPTCDVARSKRVEFELRQEKSFFVVWWSDFWGCLIWVVPKTVMIAILNL